MNRVIERYDTDLREAHDKIKRAEMKVSIKENLFAEEKADLAAHLGKIEEEAKGLEERKEAHRKRANIAEAELSMAKGVIESLKSELAKKSEEISRHIKEEDRLRRSRIHEVTQERIRVHNAMVAKSNRCYQHIRPRGAP